MALLPKVAIVLGAVCAFAVLVAPAARAFTLQDSGVAGSGSAYTDPDTKYGQKTNKDGTTSLKLGSGTTMTVGTPRNFNDDYSAGKDRMFSPLGRPADR